MAIADWVKTKTDQIKHRGSRKSNTEQENELLDQAIQRYEIARSEKTDHNNRDLHQKWDSMDRIYRGNQWKGPTPSYKSTPVLNYVFSLVESVVPRITDNAPEILVMPRHTEGDATLADQLTKTQSYLWDKNKMQRKLNEGTRMCLKYGTAIYKAVWDPDLYEGFGDVTYSVVHPKNFFPDPRAYEIHQMDYCFVSVPKSLEYFIRRWPEKGRYVVEDDEGHHTGDEDLTNRERTAALKEYWFFDENGNLCVMYYAGHVVLDIIGGKYDDNNENDDPIYRHNRFPFAKQVDYQADKEFWGIGEVEIIDTLQRLINSYEAQIIDNTRTMANAQWIVDKLRSGLKEEDSHVLNNRPGATIFVNNADPNVIRKEPGSPIPAHITEHQQKLVNAMEQILGIHDVVQGRAPGGVRAASAIIALQESANIRVRQKARNMEYALEELADQANWLVLEHYEEPRQIRLTGESAPTTLEISDILRDRVVDEAALMGEVEPDTEPEDIDPEDLQRLFREVKFPTFDVQVKAGASVPYSQAMLYEQAKEFFQLGAIDRQALLEVTGFPGREEIIQRIEGRTPGQEDQQEQMEQAMGQQAGGGQPEKAFAVPPGAGEAGGMPGGGGGERIGERTL